MGEMRFQVHHIIPVSLFNIYGEQLREILGAAKTEHVIQSYNNRIALFMEDGPANALKNLGVDGLRDVPLGATRHNDGSHKNYTEDVGEVISEIISSNLESRRTMLIDMQFSIWHDPMIAYSTFISEPLQQAIKKAGLSKGISWFSCILV